MRWLAGTPGPDSAPPPRPVYDQAVALVCDRFGHRPHGCRHRGAWPARRAALTAYRDALERAGTVSLTDLLPDLLHLHHARVAGPDIDAERGCLHLARAAALSWIARAKKAS